MREKEEVAKMFKYNFNFEYFNGFNLSCMQKKCLINDDYQKFDHHRCCCLVTKSWPTLCDPIDCSIPGSSVFHYLPEFVQIHGHWVSDAIQPSHPLLPATSFAFNLSQHQGFSNELVLHIRWPKYWSINFSIQSFQWIFRVDFL